MSPIELLTSTFPKCMAHRSEGPASCTPLVVDVGGVSWTAISNGFAGLAVSGAWAAERYDSMGRVFVRTPNDRHTRVPLAELKAWADACGPYLEERAARDEHCKACIGTGEVQCSYMHYHTCDDCDGRGHITHAAGVYRVESEYGDGSASGTLSLVPLHRRLLGALLRHVKADEVDVYANGPIDRVIIAGECWSAVIMPIRVDAPSRMPAFEATP